MDQHTQAKVELWKNNVTEPDLKAELEGLMGDEERLNDAVYRDLAFGTAGLRGVLGVGTNRMNVYVVAQATQGVADYLNAHYDKPTLALARDSRLKGEDFQRACGKRRARLCLPSHRACAHALLCGALPAYLRRHRAHGLPQPRQVQWLQGL